jgi:hypothetical protein
MSVPLATYTGWNLRAPAIGAPTQRSSFQGSFVPLHRTAAEAQAAHDPRKPIGERYKNYAEYRAAFQRALDGLVKDRYVLPEDAGQLMDRSQQEWDWISAYKFPLQ